MYLKNYQVKVVKQFKQYFKTAQTHRGHYEEIRRTLGTELLADIRHWVEKTHSDLGLSFTDLPKTGLGEYYPRVCVKMPTGGGKTLMAVEAIREYQTQFAQRKNGLIVWIVPSETIYSQTVKYLSDKGDFYRQLIDQSSGGHTIIAEKGQRITRQDVEENLVILFLMIQSVNRKDAKEGLKVFQDSGGYDTFFPADNRYDEHKALLEQIPNLDTFETTGIGSMQPQVKTSLGNLVRVARPLMIIDEFHKVFTPRAQETINHLNPSMILGFTATPRQGMNLLVEVKGIELKDEEMVKLDMHLYPPQNEDRDWRDMLRKVKQHREIIESKATDYRLHKGRYIRPIALLQVERTGKEQRGKGFVHSLDVKEYLIELGIPEHQVAIKTSSQNDIEDINLLSPDCEIRYLITKEALKEGWDCPFAYILGIIPNVNSNTGTTQLVGRILRQPYAQKSGISDLDESYIYFVNGNTEKILSQIQAGFKGEGLEDLVGKIQIPEDKFATTKTEVVSIKEVIRDTYPESLYLPVWAIKTAKGTYRRFNYDIDIKPHITFSEVDFRNFVVSTLSPALSQQTQQHQEVTITLGKESKTEKTYFQSQDEEGVSEQIDRNYFLRRVAELIENAFVASSFVDSLLSLVKELIAGEIAQHNFGFIVHQFVAFMDDVKRQKERQIFEQFVAEGHLILGVINDDTFGYTIPYTDQITVDTASEAFSRGLYTKSEPSSMNTLEKKVARTLDEQESTLWWFRNKTGKQWYAIQGWQQYKIRPDFVAARKTAQAKIDIIYILESKGKQLLGNIDTNYKQDVFDFLNKTDVTTVKSKELIHFKLHDDFQYELIAEEEEEKDIRSLFNQEGTFIKT
ncbi:hypothetical protein AUK40_02605 [Candidatus Wirthbacteria bacterium CG2_30_54_11]|uniref:Helicase ATP-binding domain-containing protein n=1 Tax=Candidatus Wirthbacteria bacterium CG2_30_54_11 TaxID=1817892 RepID=A0A1J5ILZ4_9BACT|nr:MAG: hypothetical protein AUK40_02605 [Candidatus Wirthbacteria bacterium CG2_30_54_11]